MCLATYLPRYLPLSRLGEESWLYFGVGSVDLGFCVCVRALRICVAQVMGSKVGKP